MGVSEMTQLDKSRKVSSIPDVLQIYSLDGTMQCGWSVSVVYGKPKWNQMALCKKYV